MKSTISKLLLLLAIPFFVAGCSYFDEGVPEDVAVYSFPNGADVIVQGRFVGRTPLKMELASKIPHMITLEKAGYKQWKQEIYPILNEWGTARVRFRLAQDLGFYFDLVPNPVEVQLEPALLPETAGLDPYSDMAELVMQTDKRRESGEIDPVEHKYIVDRIIKFYENAR